MNKPTDEQIKEFWEKCGLEISEEMWVEDHYEPDGRWYDSDGRLFEGDYLHGIPAIDLNNLFKYAVPKVNRQVSFYYVPAGVIANKVPVWEIELDEEPAGYDEDPALALFWAIYEVK